MTPRPRKVCKDQEVQKWSRPHTAKIQRRVFTCPQDGYSASLPSFSTNSHDVLIIRDSKMRFLPLAGLLAIFPTVATNIVNTTTPSASVVTVLGWQWVSIKTFTLLSSDSTATTYSGDDAWVVTPIQSNTTLSEPTSHSVDVTLIQGPSTYSFNAKWSPDGVPLSKANNCTWTGDITVADITCDATLLGELYQTSVEGVSVMNQEQIAMSKYWHQIDVVRPTPSAFTSRPENGGTLVSEPTASSTQITETQRGAGALHFSMAPVLLFGAALGTIVLTAML